MLIIPAIDIKDGKCVRLFKGDYEKVEVFSEDPVDMAKRWASYGAKLIHVVDLDGAKEGYGVNKEVIKEIIRSVNADIEVGGGIRDEVLVEEYFEVGAKRLVIGSMLFKNQSLAKTLLNIYTGKIIPSLDIRDKRLAISGWMEETRYTIDDAIPYLEGFGVEEIIVTDIERDGTLQGFNTSLLEYLSEKFPRIRLIVGGGITTPDDLDRISRFSNVKGVIIGKALYTGSIDFREVNRLYGGN